jgi:hypothetical protein
MSYDNLDFIESEYLIDVYEMKREFALVDIGDRNSIGVWLKDHLFLSTNDVCRIGNICLKTVYRRGVAFRTAREAVRSRHPCCTREWLLVNYVAREQSLTACARLAGVSKYTLTAWLNRHAIRVRSASEQLMLHYSGR